MSRNDVVAVIYSFVAGLIVSVALGRLGVSLGLTIAACVVLGLWIARRVPR